VVHARAVIGDNCYLGPNVIIGGRSGEQDVPVIGDNVFVGAGARILGPVKIGNGATIGAASLVLEDVPAGSTVVGVPARSIVNARKEAPTV
jgi:serine O-acetyltransferase